MGLQGISEMTAAMLNIRIGPRRMLSLREAADYCGIPAKRFLVTGISPVDMPHGQKLYDIKDLDSWLDGIKNKALHSDDAIIGRLGNDTCEN